MSHDFTCPVDFVSQGEAHRSLRDKGFLVQIRRLVTLYHRRESRTDPVLVQQELKIPIELEALILQVLGEYWTGFVI